MKPRIPPPNPQYVEFLSAYEPRIRELALATRRLVLEEAPKSTELIYDAYSAVASGYTFTGRPTDAFIHIAAYARWVNLGFNRGTLLPDPEGVLHGTGKWTRHIRMTELADIERPVVRQLVKAAVALSLEDDPEAIATGGSVVRAIYERKRRPARK